MTLLQWITKLAGLSGPELVKLLEVVRDRFPDFAVIADKWLAALGSAAAPGNLVEVAKAIPEELLNIAQGKIDPKDHPSDLA